LGLRTERVRIVGVDCPSCIYAIDRSLRSLEGLVEFKGDAATGEAVVVYDDGRLRLRDIARAIRDSGYDIHKEYLHLEVDLGEGEVIQFEEYVLKLEGVVDCRTSPVSGTATVLYNPYTTSKEVLLSTTRRRYPEVREVAEEVGGMEVGRVDSRLPLKIASFAAGLTAVVHYAFGSLGLTPPLWGVREYLYLALATVVLVLNTDILSKGFRALARGTPVMESLVSLSATVAFPR
jgi:Cu2+-exporting ATPase/Cu+-exporting ATPase